MPFKCEQPGAPEQSRVTVLYKVSLGNRIRLPRRCCRYTPHVKGRSVGRKGETAAGVVTRGELPGHAGRAPPRDWKACSPAGTEPRFCSGLSFTDARALTHAGAGASLGKQDGALTRSWGTCGRIPGSVRGSWRRTRPRTRPRSP